MTALAYEILLMRLFSIIQWHHFAYMIISLALLGYGASGTFLALFRKYLISRYVSVYLGNLVLFGFSTMICYLLSQRMQFNIEEILWDPHQVFRLAIIYIMLALPFFFVANAIGLSLFCFRKDMTRIYAADLFGAGLGSLLIIVLLFAVFPGEALRYITAFAMMASALAGWELLRHRRKILALLMPVLLTGIVLPFLLPSSWTELELSSYKGLSQALRISGAKVVAQHSSPLGLITVVENPVIPFRHAPGLSLNATEEPPEQVGIFIDGDAMTAVTHYNGGQQSLSYLDQLTSALPYHLSSIEEVLVLGAGGGAEVLQARYHNTRHIRAIELNKQIIGLLQDDYKEFSGHLYNNKDVEVIAEEARGFVSSSDVLYNLIQLVLF
ncbi:MAG: SAM-dependent methyltransferase, partial [Gammaproteobacteria bacterium]|nr:SAM-dependent methyltransferase [Gammaproteobacteria bacterium]